MFRISTLLLFFARSLAAFPHPLLKTYLPVHGAGKTKVRIPFVLSFLLPLILSAQNREPAPDITGETMQQTAKRTGYTVEEIRKYFPPVHLDYDTAGLAASRFKAPPAVGVHPRVFFNPEDLPDMRRRAKETHAGQVLSGRLRRECYLGLRAGASEAAAGKSTSVKALYDELVSGRKPAGLKPYDGEGIRLGNLLTLEAFRTLLDDDQPAAKRCASAFVTYLSLYDASEREKLKIAPDSQDIVRRTLFANPGVTYDCLYPAMSEMQRTQARLFLTAITAGKTSTGMRSLPAFPANTTNWIPFHSSLIVNVLAIEGEPGYDSQVYLGMVDTLRKWLALGLFPSGSTWESMGKNELSAEYLIPVSKRGDSLISARPARNHIANYYLQVMQPYGKEYTFFVDHGGSHSTARFIDVETMKYAFPKDAAIDFVYRNLTGDSYSYFADMRWNLSAANPLEAVGHVLRVAMAEDYMPGTWDQRLAAATSTKPLTWFDDGLGCLVARSEWSRDALQLLFQPRHIPDGHSQGDRGNFTLSALGRVWGEKLSNSGGSAMGKSAESRFESLVLIDDIGQSVDYTPSGKSLALNSDATGISSFLATDLREPYSFIMRGGGQWDRTPNDHRLEKSSLPWMDLPWGDLPHWLLGGKPSFVAPKEINRFGSVADWNPVKRAFRTAGIVRGKHPYALIVDDIQKDEAEHQYKWLMQIADDLELVTTLQIDFQNGTRPEYYTGDRRGFRADLVLAEAGKIADKAGPRLLVRVLENRSHDDPRGGLDLPGYMDVYQKDVRGQRDSLLGKKLVIPSRSVAPNYKVMLLPHRNGEPLPVTSWNSDRTRVTVDWDNQHDELAFQPGPDGRTRVAITRLK